MLTKAVLSQSQLSDVRLDGCSFPRGVYGCLGVPYPAVVVVLWAAVPRALLPRRPRHRQRETRGEFLPLSILCNKHTESQPLNSAMKYKINI